MSKVISTVCSKCGRRAIIFEDMTWCIDCELEARRKGIDPKKEKQKEEAKMSDKKGGGPKKGICRCCGEHKTYYKRDLCYDCYKTYVVIIDFSDYKELKEWLDVWAKKHFRSPDYQIIAHLQKIKEEEK